MGWWRSRGARKQVFACLAVLAAGGGAGLLAGFGADTTGTSELSPAEIVAMRFQAVVPPDVNGRDEVNPAEPVGLVLASADEQGLAGLLFNPSPIYPLSAQPALTSAPDAVPATHVVSTHPATPPADLSLPPQLALVEPEIPAQALGYAADDVPARSAPAAAPAARSEGAAPVPVKKPAPRPMSASNAVLNGAQIASIKQRLKLTSYQSTLWPPVELALRDISYEGGHDAGHNTSGTGRAGAIDPNSAPVQRLKSAAFPLLMSLSEDQKQEVRTMVRLMGLESLAAQF